MAIEFLRVSLIVSLIGMLLLVLGDWIYQQKRMPQRKHLFRKYMYEDTFVSICVSIPMPPEALSQRWFRFMCWKAWGELQKAHDDIELNEVERIFRKECKKARIEIVSDPVHIQI